MGGGLGYSVQLPTGGGVVTLNNPATGIITGATARSDVIKNGANFIINNYGHIVSPADATDDQGSFLYGGDAIDVSSDRNDLVHNFAGGWIEGSRHAITGKRNFTIINEAGGTIIGRNGSAANFDNNADPANALHVTNHGLMEGRSQGYEDSDGDAIDADGLLYLDNDGIIRGAGHNGYHGGEPNVSEGIAIGGGVINNLPAASIYGYGRAIQVDNSSNGPALAPSRSSMPA